MADSKVMTLDNFLGKVRKKWPEKENDEAVLIKDCILSVASTGEEAAILLEKIMSEVSYHEEGTTFGLPEGGDHHGPCPEVTYGSDTTSAISLAKDKVKLYRLICERVTPAIQTTGKVISIQYGPRIYGRFERALNSLPPLLMAGKEEEPVAYKLALQRHAFDIISTSGIERFEEICFETARRIHDLNGSLDKVNRYIEDEIKASLRTQRTS